MNQSNSKLTYTTAIQKGHLYLGKMDVGHSVRGVITAVNAYDKTSKSGQNYKDIVLTMQVQGFQQPVQVHATGNAKFFLKDVNEGKRALNLMTTITRADNITLKNGMTSTQFKIFQENFQGTASTPNNYQPQPATETTSPAALTEEEELKAALAFIRSKKNQTA